MAHEVIKRVGRRAYRYRVETYRDKATGKVRSHWTYAGAVQRDAGAAEDPNKNPLPAVRRAPAQTRERLLAAFERLVARLPYAAVTAGMVAAEAGLAHGTFYRYFSDKRAVFLAALDRTREEFERARPSFDPPYGPLDAERTRVRAWAEAILRRPPSNPGVLRAFFEVLETDDELRVTRSRRRSERAAAFADYLSKLSAAKIASVGSPETLSAALLALLDGEFRNATVAGVPVDPMTVAGVLSVFDRAIFMASEEGSSATESLGPESKTK
jgi:AcrR family transcriptional regulator